MSIINKIIKNKETKSKEIQKLLDKVKELESAKASATTDQSKLDLNKNYTNKSQDEQFLINAAFGFNHKYNTQFQVIIK